MATSTSTFTLDADERAVLMALRAFVARFNRPTSIESLAEDAGLGRARALRAALRLVELRLIRRQRGSYGRVRYTLTSIGEALRLDA